MKHDFYELAEPEQVQRLALLANAALARWSLRGAEVRPVAYRENMTFSVDGGDRGRFALRVHQAGYRTDAEVQSELDFMEYLRGEGVPTAHVVLAADGSSLIKASHRDVPEARQCDLFEWIDGRPLRRFFEPPEIDIDRTASLYREVGRLTATIYNASEKWQRPPGFQRPCWDAEGLFGESAHLGDFRKAKKASDAQRELLMALGDRLERDLEAFGRAPDRYGLSQADLLPENLFLCDGGLRFIDFDDSGESWFLLDLATALFDLKGSDYFDPCLAAFVEAFRERRDLPEEHLAMFPAFYLARGLSYLGHTASRNHLGQAEQAQELLLALLEENGRSYLYD